MAEGIVDDDCGGSYEVVVPSTAGEISLNMCGTISGALSLFGEARSFVEVKRGANHAWYVTEEDEIRIRDLDTWWSWGAYSVAHEYGHAFHEKALGGNNGSACDPHWRNTESSLGCAFSEGFAQYFAASTRPDLDSSYYWHRWAFEDGVYFPGCVERSGPEDECTGGISYEGSIIEGAFAAFLYDLTDSGIEAHDSINAPGSYVADIIRSCKIEYLDYTWYWANGSDAIAYCVENAINPGSYFTVRGWTPTDFSESATESGGWTSARANRV